MKIFKNIEQDHIVLSASPIPGLEHHREALDERIYMARADSQFASNGMIEFMMSK